MVWTVKTAELWFDVGIKRYTTREWFGMTEQRLWFDVGIKRYTTERRGCRVSAGCGLM